MAQPYPLDEATLHRLIIESSKDYAIFTMDEDGMLTSWNSGAEKIFGFVRDEVMGESAYLVFTPSDRAHSVPEAEIHRALTVGRALDERWHMRKDGSIFWAEGLLMPLQDGLGKNHGFVKILRDRTAQQLRLEALQTAAAEARNLLKQQVQQPEAPPRDA